MLRIQSAAAVAFALTIVMPTGVTAQASGDGRIGPRVFSDDALNQSLEALNVFLSARYAHDDIMAALAERPEKDFRTTAVTTASAPEYFNGDSLGGFTGDVNSGSALDVHLAAFNEERMNRGNSLFIKIALASGGYDLDMREAGGMPPVPGDLLAFGPSVQSDHTLEYNLEVLAVHMVEQDLRNDQLSGDGAVTGHSFDLYGEALSLF
ncbi:MAG: hypothetical protein QNI90_04075 [Dinoroseobacter sp.]|nr:hypothetical protein [Dinoroseobacter sp.]